MPYVKGFAKMKVIIAKLLVEEAQANRHTKPIVTLPSRSTRKKT